MDPTRNIYELSLHMLTLANSLEQSTVNHKWTDVDALFAQIMDTCFRGAYQLVGIDESLYQDAMNKSKEIYERISHEMNNTKPAPMIDSEVKGEVSSKPTLDTRKGNNPFKKKGERNGQSSSEQQ